MTANRDPWNEVYREILRQERGRIGEWPTEESLLAFARQELPAAEAGNVRRFLVAYPEVATALAELDEPFPEPTPGSPEGLTDLEIEHDWARLAARLQESEPAPKPPPPVTPSRRGRSHRPALGWWIGSLAASAAAFALGSFLPDSPFTKPSAPIALRSQLLIPDGQRGPAQAPMPIAPEEREGEVLLSLGSLEVRTFGEYHLSIHEIRDGREVEHFRLSGLRRNEAGAFDLLLRRHSLPPGFYRLRLYGGAGVEETLLATYSIQLE